MEFCCSLTLLGGISNWINNCLIPISQLDLSAQTAEAMSYGKERKKSGRERERVRVRDRQIHEEKGRARVIVLEID